MSRLKYATKNIFFGYISSIISILLGFISRTVFIYLLDSKYLGINGLFTNILGILSFAELGIGTAMNYSLYKPVADKDIEKIKSLMKFYKISYRMVACIVAIIGLAILPFLKFIIKGSEGIENLSIYYLIFLFNTVTSYLVSYKFSLINAEQKTYIFTNINTITNFVTVIIQMISLLIFKNFMIYLLVGSIIGIIQKYFVSIYLNKKYSYLNDKNIKPISKEELRPIKDNIIALIWHKIGEISVHQTDNIIISAFININTVGIISNYNLLINYISSFITIIFNSVVGGLGNLVATSNDNKQYYIFKIYRFIAFWLYGLTSILFLIFLSPFITLWIGNDMVIPHITLVLIVINYYMVGHRLCVNNIKVASGIFKQDKYVSILQAIINIVVSIIAVKLIGISGVYIGTIAQGLVATIIKPIIIYRELFKLSSKEYFIDSIKYVLTCIIAYIICNFIKCIFMINISWINIIISATVIFILINLIFYFIFKNRDECKYIINVLKNFRREKYAK